MAEVYFDNLIIQSPKASGDEQVVKSALIGLSDHLTGDAILEEEEITNFLINLRENLNDVNFDEFSTEAGLFIASHAQDFGPLYTIEHRNNADNVRYDDLPDVSKAYVDLGVWMLTQGLTTENANSATGISFVEHTQWPGALIEGAKRIENGRADIRAEYVRDPGYLMGGMRQSPEQELAAYLYRPTGFYAPAGEVVSITVDESWVNSGLHIRVGAHADNHSKLASTSRFPVLNADYRIDAAIDWMVTHNFRNGNPIGYDPTTDFQPIETSYQTRGHAKYIDLAAIFNTWDVLDDIYRQYYEEDLASGQPANTQVGVSHDEFLSKGSHAIDCNLASLFHFWGIHPSESVENELAELPTCDGAFERIIHYLDNALRNNVELTAFHAEKTAVEEGQLKFQIYDNLLVNFDEEEGQ
ncbi:MAG: M60 family peptidase N-terminal accessory domain-containing protein [Pseudomonadota bacterium]